VYSESHKDMAIDKSDKDLISSALGGNQIAYRHLLLKYQDMVYSVTRNLMPTEEDAQDLAQESFVKAFQSLKNFEGRSKFSTWLYTIAYNSCLTSLRKKRVKLQELTFGDDAIDFEDCYALDGFELLNIEQRQTFIKTAISTLKEIDQLILTLFYFQDQSLQEIGEICNLEANTVKVKLHRARTRLHKNLSSSLNDELKDIA